MQQDLLHKKVIELVTENYAYASVLHFFGVPFYQHSEETLDKICQQKNLDKGKVIKELEEAGKTTNPQPDFNELKKYDLDLVIEYLKVAHMKFIRYKLPYIAKLIDDIDSRLFDNPAVAEDMKVIFPVFLEDFIKHIYEEEDTLFKFIERLMQADRGIFNPYMLFRDLKNHDLKHLSEEHHDDEDKMSGLRELTNGYQVCERTTPYTKVIYTELKHFEEDLMIHACIENEILFPKAIALQNRMKLRLSQKARMN
ncbi:hemerythrin domain-containing protein [Limibacter armeniacum]|uniref:hemerythrin domain-containing protein n=1 Tax=Limibacter armeniacum TaxID=466084 RepID=UPI002FE63C88